MDLNEILKENPRLAEWHTNVESFLQSCADWDLPNIVPGTTDEALDITHVEYIDYCLDLYNELVNSVDEWEDVPNFQALGFAEWRDMKREDYSEVDEFSTNCCDCCGTALAGARHKMTALPADPSTDKRYNVLEVCTDCFMYLVNGDLPEGV